MRGPGLLRQAITRWTVYNTRDIFSPGCGGRQGPSRPGLRGGSFWPPPAAAGSGARWLLAATLPPFLRSQASLSSASAWPSLSLRRTPVIRFRAFDVSS